MDQQDTESQLRSYARLSQYYGNRLQALERAVARRFAYKPSWDPYQLTYRFLKLPGRQRRFFRHRPGRKPPTRR